jgi:hypothetical protein
MDDNGRVRPARPMPLASSEAAPTAGLTAAWENLLAELPDGTLDLSGAHLVGTCEPPCGGDICEGDRWPPRGVR